MSIVDFDGFEAGTLIENGMGFSGTLSAMTGRDGIGVALRNNVINSFMTRPFVSGSDTIYFHLGAYPFPQAISSTAQGACLFSILADGNTVAHLSANLNSSGQLNLRRGNSAGTIIATSLQSVNQNVWHSVEVKVTIHDTLGECIIKIDGEEYINFTGDTKNAGTSTRPDAITLPAGTGIASDDFLLQDTTGATNNSWTGEISIVGIRPAGNGANSGLMGSDGNQVNNYQQVDEYPILSSDYNGSAVSLAKDTYDMTAVGKAGTVLAVKTDAVMAKSDAGAKTYKHIVKSAAGLYVKSAAIAPSTTYANNSGPIWLTDADGNPWTVARVDAAEFGIEVQ